MNLSVEWYKGDLNAGLIMVDGTPNWNQLCKGFSLAASGGRNTLEVGFRTGGLDLGRDRTFCFILERFEKILLVLLYYYSGYYQNYILEGGYWILRNIVY